MNYDKKWFKSLKKPDFQPPEWVFGPAWTILYCLIFISFLLMVLAPPLMGSNNKAYILFYIQIILNFSWTPVFFGFHKIKEAFFISVALLIVTIFMTMEFFKISVAAGWLLIPYVCWLAYACYLNFGIWQLNKDKL